MERILENKITKILKNFRLRKLRVSKICIYTVIDAAVELLVLLKPSSGCHRYLHGEKISHSIHLRKYTIVDTHNNNMLVHIVVGIQHAYYGYHIVTTLNI